MNLAVKYKKHLDLQDELFRRVTLRHGNGYLIITREGHEWGINSSEVQAYTLEDD